MSEGELATVIVFSVASVLLTLFIFGLTASKAISERTSAART